MIEIIDESTDEREQYILNVGTAMRIVTLQVVNRIVKFNWGVYGPIQWPEAKAMLEGMLELSVLADEIYLRLEHEKRSGVRRSTTPNKHKRRPFKKRS